MWHLYLQSDLPQSLLDREESRMQVIREFFRPFYERKSGTQLTTNELQAVCRIVTNNRRDTYDSTPCLAGYCGEIPVVKLYFRENRYELHVLDPESTLQDIAWDVTWEEVARDIPLK